MLLCMGWRNPYLGPNASDYSKTPLPFFLSGHGPHDPEFQDFLTSLTLVLLLIFSSIAWLSFNPFFMAAGGNWVGSTPESDSTMMSLYPIVGRTEPGCQSLGAGRTGSCPVGRSWQGFEAMPTTEGLCGPAEQDGWMATSVESREPRSVCSAARP